MSERAKLKVWKTKKGKIVGEVIFANGKKMPLPSGFRVEESLNGKECEIKREKGQIVEIVIEGRKIYPSSLKAEKGKKDVIYFVPGDTKEIVEKNKCDNFSLRFYKLWRWDEKEWKIKKKLKLNDKEKNVMENLLNVMENFSRNIHSRIQHTNEELKKEGYHEEVLCVSLSFRMVIGLGAVHPHETSMTLHHIYGIPYIPGSAVKGITRHWMISSKFKNNEEEAMKDEDFRKIFGLEEGKGKVIFLDAYPVNSVNLKWDVMSPHYPRYYQEKTPPADWQSPIPIPFLTVERTKFRFYLLSENKELVKKARDLLEEALKEHGIGAKTALGYGIFE